MPSRAVGMEQVQKHGQAILAMAPRLGHGAQAKKEDCPMMDITRNQYFFAGLVLLLLGLEFNAVETFQLNGKFSQFLAERTNHPMASVSATSQTLFQSDSPPVQKSWAPPEWLGWSLISLGSVLILHSWGMKKPGT
jgi:hypothetical protein